MKGPSEYYANTNAPYMEKIRKELNSSDDKKLELILGPGFEVPYLVQQRSFLEKFNRLCKQAGSFHFATCETNLPYLSLIVKMIYSKYYVRYIYRC